MKYTRTQIRYAQDLRKAGLSLKEIHQATGIEIATLQWHCKGFPPKANGRTLQARQLEDILALWQPGKRYPLPNWILSMLEDCEPLPNDWRDQAGDTILPAIPQHNQGRANEH